MNKGTGKQSAGTNQCSVGENILSAKVEQSKKRSLSGDGPSMKDSRAKKRGKQKRVMRSCK